MYLFIYVVRKSAGKRRKSYLQGSRFQNFQGGIPPYSLEAHSFGARSVRTFEKSARYAPGIERFLGDFLFYKPSLIHPQEDYRKDIGHNKLLYDNKPDLLMHRWRYPSLSIHGMSHNTTTILYIS